MCDDPKNCNNHEEFPFLGLLLLLFLIFMALATEPRVKHVTNQNSKLSSPERSSDH